MPARGAGLLAMTEAEFLRYSGYIEREFGIKMPSVKRGMLENRLARRVEACGLRSFDAYFEFATMRSEDEFLRFSDLVSTHETSFFREPGHFAYLRRTVLPELRGESSRRRIAALCAACSTGEEAYSLGMVLDASLEEGGRGDIEYSVEGIDLSSRAIEIARRGVYLKAAAERVPEESMRRYVMTSRDKSKDLCRIVPELRSRMVFHAGNLLGDSGMRERAYDLIFCRNVLIYFDKPNQLSLATALLEALKPGGLLFLGHSESSVGFGLPAKIVSHSVFKKG